MGKRNTLDVVRSSILTIASIIGGACILLVLAGIMFGLRPLVVVSGSMEPAIPTGSLILVQQKQAEELRVGDIVTVPRPDADGFVTHRIVDKSSREDGAGVDLVLKGDANEHQDPQPYSVESAERVALTLPFVGLLVKYLQSPFGVVAGVILVLAVVSLYTIRPTRLDEAIPEGSGRSTPISTPTPQAAPHQQTHHSAYSYLATEPVAGTSPGVQRLFAHTANASRLQPGNAPGPGVFAAGGATAPQSSDAGAPPRGTAAGRLMEAAVLNGELWVPVRVLGDPQPFSGDHTRVQRAKHSGEYPTD